MTETTSAGSGFWTAGRMVAIVLGLLVVALAAANFDSVEVNFLVFRLSMPIFFLLLGALVIGYVVGWLSRRTKKS